MYQYIKNIDISYRQKNIEFFNMSRYFRYIAIFYARSLHFYYCIIKITRINEENGKLTEAN